MQGFGYLCKFQSMPPRGGQRNRCTLPQSNDEVSIHAPAWGATPVTYKYVVDHRGFNPCPRVGGNPPLSGSVIQKNLCFNPCPRVGGNRIAVVVFDDVRCVSIHAPAWGATTDDTRQRMDYAEFQSMPPRGGQRFARPFPT